MSVTVIELIIACTFGNSREILKLHALVNFILE